MRFTAVTPHAFKPNIWGNDGATRGREWPRNSKHLSAAGIAQSCSLSAANPKKTYFKPTALVQCRGTVEGLANNPGIFAAVGRVFGMTTELRT